MVNEYISDNLASDSDDDKRIHKAESAALQKQKKRQQQQETSKRNKTNFNNAVVTSNAIGNHLPNNDHHQFFHGTRTFRTFQLTDRCFACRVLGHWRQHCPGIKRNPKPELARE